MSRETKILVAVILANFIGLAVGAYTMREVDDLRAVKAGKAEYYLDESNERQWRWKP